MCVQSADRWDHMDSSHWLQGFGSFSISVCPKKHQLLTNAPWHCHLDHGFSSHIFCFPKIKSFCIATDLRWLPSCSLPYLRTSTFSFFCSVGATHAGGSTEEIWRSILGILGKMGGFCDNPRAPNPAVPTLCVCFLASIHTDSLWPSILWETAGKKTAKSVDGLQDGP